MAGRKGSEHGSPHQMARNRPRPTDRGGVLALEYLGQRLPGSGETPRWPFCAVAGLSVPLVALAGDTDSLNEFHSTATRSEQTALGAVMYILVWLFIWQQGNPLKLPKLHSKQRLSPTKVVRRRGSNSPATLDPPRLVDCLSNELGRKTRCIWLNHSFSAPRLVLPRLA